jgi:hypothetical protein
MEVVTILVDGGHQLNTGCSATRNIGTELQKKLQPRKLFKIVKELDLLSLNVSIGAILQRLIAGLMCLCFFKREHVFLAQKAVMDTIPNLRSRYLV